MSCPDRFNSIAGFAETCRAFPMMRNQIETLIDNATASGYRVAGVRMSVDDAGLWGIEVIVHDVPLVQFVHTVQL